MKREPREMPGGPGGGPHTSGTRALLRASASRARAGGPGMDLAHDVLVAMTMGIALALLGMTTWLWSLAR